MRAASHRVRCRRAGIFPRTRRFSVRQSSAGGVARCRTTVEGSSCVGHAHAVDYGRGMAKNPRFPSDVSLRDFIEAVGSADEALGVVSAAAAAGGLGSSLLLMVAALPQ